MAGIALNDTTKAPTISETKGEVHRDLNPTSLQKINPSVKELKDYLAKEVAIYGGNYALLDDVIKCESGWRIDPPHNGISMGIAQFTESTWHDFCLEYGEYEDINPYSQLRCMVKMVNKGLIGRWDCFRMLN